MAKTTKSKTPLPPSKLPVAVIITDTHMDEDNMDVNESIFDQALSKAEELKLDKVYHMGDIFDSRKAQPQSVLNRFAKIIDKFHDRVMWLVAIPGNHDKTDYGSVMSFIEPYRYRPGFQLHSEVASLPGNDKVELWMIPFFADDEYVKQIEQIRIPRNETRKQVLLTHIGVNGAVMNNGVAVTTKVTSDLFEKFDLTLIGHYHDPQHYSDKIRYVGASAQHNFGESPTKGLHILYDDLSLEFVELEGPRFVNYEIDVTQVTLKDIEEIKKEKANTKDHIRITLVGDEKDIKSFDASKLKDIGVDVKKKQNEIKQEEIESRVEAFNDTSILGAFEAFCKKNKLDHAKGSQYLSQALGFTIEEEEENV